MEEKRIADLVREVESLKLTIAEKQRENYSLQAQVRQRDATIASLNSRVEQLTAQRNVAGGTAALLGIGALALLGRDD